MLHRAGGRLRRRPRARHGLRHHHRPQHARWLVRHRTPARHLPEHGVRHVVPGERLSRARRGPGHRRSDLRHRAQGTHLDLRPGRLPARGRRPPLPRAPALRHDRQADRGRGREAAAALQRPRGPQRRSRRALQRPAPRDRRQPDAGGYRRHGGAPGHRAVRRDSLAQSAHGRVRRPQRPVRRRRPHRGGVRRHRRRIPRCRGRRRRRARRRRGRCPHPRQQHLRVGVLAVPGDAAPRRGAAAQARRQARTKGVRQDRPRRAHPRQGQARRAQHRARPVRGRGRAWAGVGGVARPGDRHAGRGPGRLLRRRLARAQPPVVRGLAAPGRRRDQPAPAGAHRPRVGARAQAPPAEAVRRGHGALPAAAALHLVERPEPRPRLAGAAAPLFPRRHAGAAQGRRVHRHLGRGQRRVSQRAPAGGDRPRTRRRPRGHHQHACAHRPASRCGQLPGLGVASSAGQSGLPAHHTADRRHPRLPRGERLHRHPCEHRKRHGTRRHAGREAAAPADRRDLPYRPRALRGEALPGHVLPTPLVAIRDVVLRRHGRGVRAVPRDRPRPRGARSRPAARERASTLGRRTAVRAGGGGRG